MTIDTTGAIRRYTRSGKVHPILLWLLGVPIPVIIILLLVRGCTA